MPPVKRGPLKKVSPLSSEMEDELITVFKDIMNHEREVEEAKLRVIQNEDFNLLDCFSLFDEDNKGYLTAP